jgi:ubiquinone/menaquinone biosynthesis C-methylase UbiE
MKMPRADGLRRMFEYAVLGAEHSLSRPTLDRVPEGSSVTSDCADVLDYNRVTSTVMALPYALALNLIHRSRSAHGSEPTALDMCCGPGLLSLLLANELHYAHVLGIDLSAPMLQTAARNAETAGAAGRMSFLRDDALTLVSIETQRFDLVTFCNGAHHFDALSDVTRALRQAERVAKPTGLIFVMDPVRPRTARLAAKYVRVAGQDYLDRGMISFHEQFRQSVNASWTPDELKSAIPAGSQRKWIQIVPYGFPSFQVLLGLPVGQSKLALGESLPRSALRRIIPPHAALDWQFLKNSFRLHAA